MKQVLQYFLNHPFNNNRKLQAAFNFFIWQLKSRLWDKPYIHQFTSKSNIGGGSDNEVGQFINQLQQAKNVVLHGAVHPKQLAIEFQRMDVFLITYDILKDQSSGTNYHKVMEYLSTGNVIVSNNITTYLSLANLIEMTPSRTHNKELPQLFKTVISNLKHYNQPQFVDARKEFALSNLYSKKIGEIEKLIKN